MCERKRIKHGRDSYANLKLDYMYISRIELVANSDIILYGKEHKAGTLVNSWNAAILVKVGLLRPEELQNANRVWEANKEYWIDINCENADDYIYWATNRNFEIIEELLDSRKVSIKFVTVNKTQLHW